MNIKQKLKDYFEIEKQIHEYFGFDEEWRVYPIQDCTDHFWTIEGEFIYSHDTINIYDELIHNDIVLEKNEFTMVCINTQCDGNIFLSIFDNNRKTELPFTNLNDDIY